MTARYLRRSGLGRLLHIFRNASSLTVSDERSLKAEIEVGETMIGGGTVTQITRDEMRIGEVRGGKKQSTVHIGARGGGEKITAKAMKATRLRTDALRESIARLNDDGQDPHRAGNGNGNGTGTGTEIGNVENDPPQGTGSRAREPAEILIGIVKGIRKGTRNPRIRSAGKARRNHPDGERSETTLANHRTHWTTLLALPRPLRSQSRGEAGAQYPHFRESTNVSQKVTIRN